MIPVEYFFVLSALLFFIGVFGFITRRNLIAMLISVELILNSVDYQLCSIQPLVVPRTDGRFLLHFVQHRRKCCGNSCCSGNYY